MVDRGGCLAPEGKEWLLSVLARLSMLLVLAGSAGGTPPLLQKIDPINEGGGALRFGDSGDAFVTHEPDCESSWLGNRRKFSEVGVSAILQISPTDTIRKHWLIPVVRSRLAVLLYSSCFFQHSGPSHYS